MKKIEINLVFCIARYFQEGLTWRFFKKKQINRNFWSKKTVFGSILVLFYFGPKKMENGSTTCSDCVDKPLKKPATLCASTLPSVKSQKILSWSFAIWIVLTYERCLIMQCFYIFMYEFNFIIESLIIVGVYKILAEYSARIVTFPIKDLHPH